MKRFIKEYKNKFGKEERLDYLAENLDRMVNFYVRRGRNEQEVIAEAFKKMNNMKTAKAFKKLAKLNKKDGEFLPVGLPVLLYAFVENIFQVAKSDEEKEILSVYSDTIDLLLEKKIKKMVKKTGCTEALAKELLVKVPDKQFAPNEKSVAVATYRICGTLYRLVEKPDFIDTTDGKHKNVQLYRNIFKFLFEEDLVSNVAVNILLENKINSKDFKTKQKDVWNALTIFALSEIEGFNKKVIKELVKYYGDRRMNDDKKGRDQARRIVLSQNIDKEAFPKLSKVVEKLSDKKGYADVL